MYKILVLIFSMFVFLFSCSKEKGEKIEVALDSNVDQELVNIASENEEVKIPEIPGISLTNSNRNLYLEWFNQLSDFENVVGNTVIQNPFRGYLANFENIVVIKIKHELNDIEEELYLDKGILSETNVTDSASFEFPRKKYVYDKFNRIVEEFNYEGNTIYNKIRHFYFEDQDKNLYRFSKYENSKEWNLLWKEVKIKNGYKLEIYIPSQNSNNYLKELDYSILAVVGNENNICLFEKRMSDNRIEQTSIAYDELKRVHEIDVVDKVYDEITFERNQKFEYLDNKISKIQTTTKSKKLAKTYSSISIYSNYDVFGNWLMCTKTGDIEEITTREILYAEEN